MGELSMASTLKRKPDSGGQKVISTYVLSLTFDGRLQLSVQGQGCLARAK